MLKPEASLMVGLATATLVYGIYSQGLPSIADERLNDPNNDDLATAEKGAAWTSAVAVAGISLIAKDATVFVLGGSMIVALAWWHRHANTVNPEFGTAVPKGDNLPEQFDESQMAQAENYANDGTYANF
jgi:hypothetical protein